MKKIIADGAGGSTGVAGRHQSMSAMPRGVCFCREPNKGFNPIFSKQRNDNSPLYTKNIQIEGKIFGL
jgi:hypothetical protein